jgi:predicted RNase H-like nuclease (RuvC/YqgF family)
MKIIAEAVQKFKEYENIVKTLRIRINKSEAENKMLSKENVKLNDEISTDVASKNLVNFVLKSYKEKATVREKKIQDLSNEISNQKAEIQILSNIISSIRNLLHQATFRTYSKKVEN